MNDPLSAPGVALRAETLIALRRVALAAARDPVLAALPGGIATRRIGHGLEVADTREYVGGDDIRHLDRGTTARTGQLHVRRFQEERDRVTLLIADFRHAMFWGLKRAFRSVAAAEALALVGWNVVETGGRVGLLAITEAGPVVVPVRGRVRGMLDVIGGLVTAHDLGLRATRARTPLDAALAAVERLTPSGSELVLASSFDEPGPGLDDRLDALSRRRQPALLMIADGAVRTLPRGRYPVQLADGRRFRLRTTGRPGTLTTPRIGGRAAVVIDAGASVEETARLLSARLARPGIAA